MAADSDAVSPREAEYHLNTGTLHLTLTFDLHAHSTASDGAYAPEELVHEAAQAGVDVLALTDHDTLAGLAAAQKAAIKNNIRFISGVEISVGWQRRTLHIVGLGIAADCEKLCAGLQGLQLLRRERAERIAGKLEQLGLENVLEKAESMANGAQITRTHFARLLVKSGLSKDMKQSFKRYLASGKPAHVSSEWTSLASAVDWIHTAGGVAVLAHPMAYNMTAAWRQRMYKAFREAGGDAMEVCCGNSNAEQVQLSTRDALEYELMGSVGSDFHHPEQRWIGLGKVPPLPAAITPVWTDARLAIV